MKRYIKATVRDILDEEKEFQIEVASDINSPIDDLIKLCMQYSNWDAYTKARFSIKRLAHSDNAARIFEGDPELRDRMATTCLDADLLSILAEDPDDDVRWSVAWESMTPPETLDKLSHDSYCQIRASVGANENTPDYTLARLSKDEDGYVRLHVAQNPNTPYAVLLKLLNDDDSDIREVSLKNIENQHNSRR